jgi:hypothetical protein
MSKLKFNPFRPNSIVTPGMFQGRMNELLKAEDSLFQTKHGNPQHFIIEGERGIGKSSLLLAIDGFAKGALELRGERFNFLVVSLELTSSMGHHEILRKLASALKAEIATKQQLRDLTKTAMEFLSKIEAMGVRYHKDSPALSEPFEMVEEIASAITSFLKESVDQYDGILFLLDEADKPEASANLGESLKLLTERLTKKGAERVAIGIAGLPTLLDKLKESHESSPRLFTIMTLEPLEPEERLKVIEIGLKEIRLKTDVTVKIDAEAASLLSELSEGYPHFLQQFAYSAVEEDTENHITVEDVRRGAFKEHGALDQLGNKYFYDMYNSISSDDYRRVLQAMAEGMDAWISRADIIEKSKLKSATVDNALQSLKQKGAILQSDSRRGEYKLPTKSFAVWIKATAEKPL